MNYTLRVYGLLIHNGHVLLAREQYGARDMVKFPGGGMEAGEGTLDALRREFREELNEELTAVHHFYTTDFFVASAFHPDTQVMSIYYRIAVADPTRLPVEQLLQHERGTHSFHWMALEELEPELLTFPIDRHVATLLKTEMVIP